MDFDYVFWGGDMIDESDSPDEVIHSFYERSNNMTRVQKALAELEELEIIYDTYETPDFVEVVGSQGGDVSKYRVYFDKHDNVTFVGIK